MPRKKKQTDQTRYLLIGENPFGMAGNSGMSASVMADFEGLDTVMATIESSPVNVVDAAAYTGSVRLVSIYDGNSIWGHSRVLSLLASGRFDVVLFIGVDIWRYHTIFDQIDRIKKAHQFRIHALFPYDLNYIRPDWLNMIRRYDTAMVYSQHGYDLLAGHVENLFCYTPRLHQRELFAPRSRNERLMARHKLFPTVSDDTIVYGFIGKNQVRKDPQRLIKAFALARDQFKHKSVLYMHTDMTNGSYNLVQYADDCGYRSGDLIVKNQSAYTRQDMVEIYNAIDVMVNCSMHEGLSWSPMEAAACHTPMILSETSAHKDYSDLYVWKVHCNQPAYYPAETQRGPSWIDTVSCRAEDIASAMLDFDSMDQAGREKFGSELGVMNDKIVLRESELKPMPEMLALTIQESAPVLDQILFAQHSSAGDVLMTTQCLRELSTRHGQKLVYMTQSKFKNIVDINPYVGEVIEWDDALLNRYSVVYNPHGEHILHGGFNSNDTPLHALYPYFCQIKDPDMPMIAPDDSIHDQMQRDGLIDNPYIVLHTTGGSRKYRCYPHMDQVAKFIRKANRRVLFVQLGAATDRACNGADIDMRGKLTFRQSAYVMQRASLAIVVDSFLSHLAGAVNTPAIVLYGPAPARVVQPRTDAPLINLEPNKLDVCPTHTSCWGQANQATCNHPCIESINPMHIYTHAIDMLVKMGAPS